MPKFKVLAFSRRPLFGQYSVERINSNLEFLKSELFTIDLLRSKFPSQGLLNRFKICFQLLSNNSYNLVHITGDITFSIVALIKPIKVITILDLRYKMYAGLRKKILKYFWYTLPIKLADKVITISSEVQEEIINNFSISRDKITVVPVPINSQFFAQYTSETSINDKIKVLIVGTKANKNVENMLRALDMDYPFELLIIGPLSNCHLNLLQKINYSNIEIATDSEILEAYRWADCLLFASNFEGFGMPIIEAQATNTVVITSNFEPMKTVSGGHAILVDPKDIESIRSGLRTIKGIVGDYEFLRRARTNALRYSSTEYCNSLSRIYEDLLTAKG